MRLFKKKKEVKKYKSGRFVNDEGVTMIMLPGCFIPAPVNTIMIHECTQFYSSDEIEMITKNYPLHFIPEK